jgi:hypothetical protein
LFLADVQSFPIPRSAAIESVLTSLLDASCQYEDEPDASRVAAVAKPFASEQNRRDQGRGDATEIEL